MTTVEVRGVTKVFAGPPAVTALDAVDLTVASGCLHAVIGPSGCGKTTLLRMLAGFDGPDSGEILFDGRIVADQRRVLAPERRRVGLVPQDGALFPHLDVATNVAFGLQGHTRADRRRRVEELLELTGLAGLGRRRPHELSGGQQQRVSLARALAPGPSLVLLDEPFSSLDTQLRTSLRDQVAQALRATGATALLVTHDQAEAFAIADQVSLMRAGRLIATGSPTELYHHPVDLAAARFVGDVVAIPGTADGDHVLCSLGRLRTTSATTQGASGTVTLRPEQIQPARDGAITGHIEAVSFEGSTLRVTLRIGNDVIRAWWASYQQVPPTGPVELAVHGDVGWFPTVALETPVDDGQGVEVPSGVS